MSFNRRKFLQSVAAAFGGLAVAPSLTWPTAAEAGARVISDGGLVFTRQIAAQLPAAWSVVGQSFYYGLHYGVAVAIPIAAPGGTVRFGVKMTKPPEEGDEGLARDVAARFLDWARQRGHWA